MKEGTGAGERENDWGGGWNRELGRERRNGVETERGDWGWAGGRRTEEA